MLNSSCHVVMSVKHYVEQSACSVTHDFASVQTMAGFFGE